MAPKRTVYVKEADEQVWKRAEKLAGESISSVLAQLLHRYVEQKEAEGKQPTSRQVVSVHSVDDDATVRKAFEGRWLVTDFASSDPAIGAGFVWSVARTTKGNLVVCTRPRLEQEFHSFDVYESIADAEDCHVPADLLSAVASEIGEDYVEELDI